MPESTAEAPSVSLSFANNFWGKEDAGVHPMLDRMHNAKTTGDELKSFYNVRTAIEEDYARKLLQLARKPFGSGESGTLRMSLDVVRGEVESMGKAHQNVAIQMRRELDEPLTAFAGGMKERRKIVQGGIERLLKLKQQQTATANKARDRYEQDCLKIKGYLAQGHMVMGQEERKNKAKLEKTQIQLSTNNHDYEAAIRVLEETTGRWNKEWKAACDKFQDLEEERIDFMKSSLWAFANIASTVCVSDDASCEKIRLSLEDCDVEKDITNFIRDHGTGQEIPDAPSYVDFRRADASDALSEASDDGKYSVAQFQRTMNPAYRSSSPQPSMTDPATNIMPDSSQEYAGPGFGATGFPSARKSDPSVAQQDFAAPIPPEQMAEPIYGASEYPTVPHNEYPLDGMTQFCRTGPPSGASSAVSQQRSPSRDSYSDYSNANSFTSQEPSLGTASPTKHLNGSDLSSTSASKDGVKKKSGFFQNRSPFRRKSKSENENPYSIAGSPTPSKRNTWASSARGSQPPAYDNDRAVVIAPGTRPSASPEPADPRASFQLNVGNNVFDVASPDHATRPATMSTMNDELDPIAQALAELKGVSKESSARVSADRYHGIATPGPNANPRKAPEPSSAPPSSKSRSQTLPIRGDAPPSYEQPAMSRLGAPQPAFTSRQMQQTTQKYVDQKQNMFNHQSRYGSQDRKEMQASSSPVSRPGSQVHSRATSPVPFRSASPRPGGYAEQSQQPRAASPNPYGGSYQRPRPHSTTPMKGQNNGYGNQSLGGYGNSMPRAVSPQPQMARASHERPVSRGENMSMQLAQPSMQSYQPQQQQQQQHGSWRGPGQAAADGRSQNQYMAGNTVTRNGYDQNRPRSQSTVNGGSSGHVTSDGRQILHFSRAMYMYQAAIPEELSFAKGDMLAVLNHQDDGWWEAEVLGKNGGTGLVPSNYLAVA